jgi:hypothetical protein
MTITIIISLIATVFGIVIAPFTFAKILLDLRAVRRGSLREEYKFAKEFFNDLGLAADSQPIVIERGYKAIAGTKALTLDEIKYILTLPNPDFAFFAYNNSRKLLVYQTDTKQVEYRSRWMANTRKRVFLQYLSLAGYVCLALIAILPAMFHVLSNPLPPEWITSSFLGFIPILIPALMCLSLSEAISSAHQFMQLQNSRLHVNNDVIEASEKQYCCEDGG